MISNTKPAGLLYIISAPSGAGKTSLVNALVQSISDLEISVSHTTRQKREGEVDGVNYHFIDDKHFDQMVRENRFLEYAHVFDHQYGTSRDWVEERLESGRSIILEIDWQGAKQLLKIYPEAVSIFILPPSYQALENRLIERGDDDAETIQRRMSGALLEISHYDGYDFVIINDKFSQALEDLRAVIQASRLGLRQQQAYYKNFVGGLIEEGQQDD